MSIVTGILKDKLGNELHPLTSASQVIVDESTRLDATLTSIQTSITTINNYFTEEGTLKTDNLPDVINKFKGVFASENELPSTGEAGDYAICTDTDTVWIWDAEKEGGEGWIDTGQKGSVSSVNGKTGDVVIEMSDIDGLVTTIAAKIDTTAIVDALTSTAADAPLSANQGKVLYDMITSLEESGASSIDAAVIENGATVPSNLADTGLYFEKDA